MLTSFGLAISLVASATTVNGAALESGLPVGDAVPAFQVVKYAGALEDGVGVGEELCYR